MRMSLQFENEKGFIRVFVRKDQNCDTDKIGRQAVWYSTKTERQALGHTQEMTEDRKTSGYEARSVPSVTWHPDDHILSNHRMGSENQPETLN